MRSGSTPVQAPYSSDGRFHLNAKYEAASIADMLSTPALQEGELVYVKYNAADVRTGKVYQLKSLAECGLTPDKAAPNDPTWGSSLDHFRILGSDGVVIGTYGNFTVVENMADLQAFDLSSEVNYPEGHIFIVAFDYPFRAGMYWLDRDNDTEVGTRPDYNVVRHNGNQHTFFKTTNFSGNSLRGVPHTFETLLDATTYFTVYPQFYVPGQLRNIYNDASYTLTTANAASVTGFTLKEYGNAVYFFDGRFKKLDKTTHAVTNVSAAILGPLTTDFNAQTNYYQIIGNKIYVFCSKAAKVVTLDVSTEVYEEITLSGYSTTVSSITGIAITAEKIYALTGNGFGAQIRSYNLSGVQLSAVACPGAPEFLYAIAGAIYLFSENVSNQKEVYLYNSATDNFPVTPLLTCGEIDSVYIHRTPEGGLLFSDTAYKLYELKTDGEIRQTTSSIGNGFFSTDVIFSGTHCWILNNLPVDDGAANVSLFDRENFAEIDNVQLNGRVHQMVQLPRGFLFITPRSLSDINDAWVIDTTKMSSIQLAKLAPNTPIGTEIAYVKGWDVYLMIPGLTGLQKQSFVVNNGIQELSADGTTWTFLYEKSGLGTIGGGSTFGASGVDSEARAQIISVYNELSADIQAAVASQTQLRKPAIDTRDTARTTPTTDAGLFPDKHSVNIENEEWVFFRLLDLTDNDDYVINPTTGPGCYIRKSITQAEIIKLASMTAIFTTAKDNKLSSIGFLGYQEGTDAGKPTPTSALEGHWYFATDTKVLYRCNAVSWVQMADYSNNPSNLVISKVEGQFRTQQNEYNSSIAGGVITISDGQCTGIEEVYINGRLTPGSYYTKTTVAPFTVTILLPNQEGGHVDDGDTVSIRYSWDNKVTINTTDATTQIISTIAIPSNNTVVFWEATVIGYTLNMVEAFGGTISGVFKRNNSGAVSLVTSWKSEGDDSSGAPALSMTADNTLKVAELKYTGEGSKAYTVKLVNSVVRTNQ